jgi:membrane protease YdiL (CAAX protease family)
MTSSTRTAVHVIAFAILAAWTVRVLAYPMVDGAIGNPVTRRLFGEAVRLVLLVGLPLALIMAFERRPWRSPLGLPVGHRPVLAWTIVVAWLGMITVIDLLTNRPQPLVPGGMRIIALAIVLIGTFIGALAEEFAFRGVLLPRLLLAFGAVKGHLATAGLFVLLHWPGWLFLQGMEPSRLVIESGQLFLFGLVLGVVTVLAGSLWPAIALHAANNLLVGLVFHRSPI